MEEESKIIQGENQQEKAQIKYPLTQVALGNITSIGFNGWEFVYTNERILKSVEGQAIHKYIGIQQVPDMLYGFNRLLIINKQTDFLYSFSPLDALKLCKYDIQKSADLIQILKTKDDVAPGVIYSDVDKNLLNSINIMPEGIEVKGSHLWKGKDLSKVEDLTTLEKNFDWSFSTPYKGKIDSFKHAVPQLIDELNQLPIFTEIQGGAQFKATLVPQSDEQIPLSMLGQDNPIKHYGEVVLFEDELGDKGYSKSNVRFRIMNDCFFLLLRSYIRIDHVIVRILDTRVFHKFGESYLIRDFQVREATYTELKKKGFKLTSDWSLSPAQSDEIYGFLPLKQSFCEKIVLQ